MATTSPSLTRESSLPLHHCPTNDITIPVLGFGTYLCSTAEAESGVTAALAAGYRHIDTAEYYNNHEGIAAALANHPSITRDQLFITDKVSPGGLFGAPDRTYEEIKALCSVQLQRLGTSYLDLYLLHHAFAKGERVNQYRALLDLQKEGLVRAVGVSNWNEKHIEELRAAGLPLPAVNQIEIHPLCTQHKLIAYLNANNIVPVAYSSLAPLSTWRVEEGQASAKTATDEEPGLLPKLSKKYGKSEAQILLRWAVQHGYPILPKVRFSLSLPQ